MKAYHPAAALLLGIAVLHAQISITHVPAGTASASEPEHARYRNLQKALVRYEAIAARGGWSENPETYVDVNEVARRLILTDDLAENEGNDGYAEAVRAFQRRQGLAVDGIVGPRTRAKLAEGVGKTLARIHANLRRWERFGPVEADEYVMVNIADFSLELVSGGRTLRMRAVMGREGRKTPQMTARMESLVFNPYWRIPETILAEDVLPALRKNSGYLSAHGIALFDAGDKSERRPVDPAEVNWTAMTPETLHHYVFRQSPGPKNPLGVVKFVFPNPDDIYIHDSPSAAQFREKSLLDSSGCIRVEKPIELAYGILQRERPALTYKGVFELLQSHDEKTLYLRRPLPVYITYQTAWANEEGRLFERDDVYGYDEAEALR